MASDAPRALPEVLAEFAQVLVDDHGIEDILDRLGDYCTELLPVHGIGVLLDLDDGKLLDVTANTEAGRTVERLEAELHEGPCTDAIRTGSQVVVADLESATDRYPRLAPAAIAAGVRSIHALPMCARTGAIGALDIIDTVPQELSTDHLTTAQALADVAVAYVVNSRIRTDTSRLARQLQEALDGRIVIEQAKGSLAERNGEPVDSAYERLRSHARRHRVPVRDGAEQVLRGDLDV